MIAEIDWTWDGCKIHDRIRGLNPRPLAFFTGLGQKRRVERSRLGGRYAQKAVPGSLLTVRDAGRMAEVVCGDGRIIELFGIDPGLNTDNSVGTTLR
ncbi:hypothetical protein ACFLQR_05395 [Verrucomicrobiota bacterium]